MIKEITFKIEVGSEKDLEKVHESLRVMIGNFELARLLKFIDSKLEKIEKKSR